jgi:hypothetical protein
MKPKVMRRTEIARVIEARCESDGEGPSYRVKYQFSVSGEKYRYEAEFSYDSFHSARAGWSSDRLDEFWRAGNMIKVEVDPEHPELHELERPFEEEMPMPAVRRIPNQDI